MVTEVLNEIYDPDEDIVIPEPLFFETQSVPEEWGCCAGACAGSASHNYGHGSVYLAGPITGTMYEDARYGWRKYASDRINPGIRILSPMRHEGQLAEELGPIKAEYNHKMNPKHLYTGGRIIVGKDHFDINQADVILVNLIGAERVSIGTMVEIGIAYAKRKAVVVAMEKGNIHDHPFVTSTAMVVTETLDDAITIVNGLLSEGI